MKAITVVFEPSFWRRWLRPVEAQRQSLTEQYELTGQALDKHVHTLVAELISTGGEHVNRVLEIEVVMTIEMPANKVVDLFFRLDVKILKFVHRSKFDDVEAVGKNAVYEDQRRRGPKYRLCSPGLRLRRCSLSKAVIWLTVVKTSAQCAADRSMQ